MKTAKGSIETVPSKPINVEDLERGLRNPGKGCFYFDMIYWYNYQYHFGQTAFSQPHIECYLIFGQTIDSFLTPFLERRGSPMQAPPPGLSAPPGFVAPHAFPQHPMVRSGNH